MVEPESGSENQPETLEQQVRRELEEFEENHPGSVGEYFGNLPQYLSGGTYTKLHPSPEHDQYVRVVDEIAKETTAEREDLLRQMGEDEGNKQLGVIVNGLISKCHELAKDQNKLHEDALKQGQPLDERRIEELGGQIGIRQQAVNEILLPIYVKLREKGHTHDRITH